MRTLQYRLEGGLLPEQIEQLYQKVQEILRSTGIQVTPRMAARLQGKAGFNCVDDTVRIAPEKVRECVRRAAAQQPDKRFADWELELLSSYPIYHFDFRTEQIMPFDTQTVIELTKLTDGLLERGVVGSTPGVPQDVPPALRHLKCLQIGALYSRFGPDVPVSSPITADWMLPMLEVTETVPEFGVFILNPLKCEGDTLDTLLKYPDRFPRITVGSMPLMGLTAPIDFIGATLIGLSAAIGTLVLCMEIVPDAKYLLEPRIWPVDFHDLNILYGSPETELSTLISYQFLQHFGLQTGGTKAFHSMAAFPDAQANGQRGCCGVLDALSGVRKFTFGGLLATDMVFSAQQLLFDLELLSYYRHLCKGISFDIESAMEQIRSVGNAGSYLEEDETLLHYSELWRSRLWRTAPIGWYIEKREKDLMQMAKDEIEHIISKHSFFLEEEKAKELDQIYARAEKALL